MGNQKQNLIQQSPRFYTIQGKKYPSVTTITGSMAGFEWQGALDSWKIKHKDYNHYREELEKTQKRGTRVHDACELLLTGQEVTGGALKGISTYVNAFKGWMKEFPALCNRDMIIEEVVYSDWYGYAGRADLIKDSTLIDLKTSKACPSKPKVVHAMQAVAYSRAWKFGLEPYVLYVDAKGRYRFFRVERFYDLDKLFEIFVQQVEQFNRWQQLPK